jgi:TRAP-type C4-dicarboxylate transport system permease small subunit
MNDASPESPPPPQERHGPLFYLGALALLGVVTVDAAAVLGRHIGIRLLGSIEIVQALILIAGCASIVASTLARKHASVHLLTERLRPTARTALVLCSNALGAVFFVLLAAGAVWIAADEWHGHEQSELLGLPYAPLRLISIGALLAAAGVLIYQMLRPPRP